jgi:FAD/FMN-containing dehydrogenase/ferredoxin
LLGHSLAEFTALPATERAEKACGAVGDLHDFLDAEATGGPAEPDRTVRLAASLAAALPVAPDSPAGPRAQVITSGLVREQCGHDQNVYLGRLFTHHLTRAVPDVLFQPARGAEVAAALHWARKNEIPVTLRGAASTAMGGAVPADGGLLLDTARLDTIEIDAAEGSVTIGTGVRMRPLHAALAESGLALPAYPSNLGGTYAGWLATGGIGMNAYGRGRALDFVRAAELVLPGCEHVRLTREGALEVIEEGERREVDSSEAWFRSKGYTPLTLADLAGSEGQLGVLVRLELDLEPLPDLAVFLLAFAKRADALAAVEWIGTMVSDGVEAPGDVKLLSGSHVHHSRKVWAENDGLEWRSHDSALSGDAQLPWRELRVPSELGAAVTDAGGEAGVYLYVDFLSAAGGRAFAERLGDCPGTPSVSDADSARFARDRFRPQQVKRLGPGFLAAEILMPAQQVPAFLPAAEKLARGAGVELDAEVYYLSDGTALPIAGYVTDHRRGKFHVDLLVVPALLELAEQRFEGKPYVLGRWQAAHLERKFDADQLARLRTIKAGLDPAGIVGRGSFFDMGLRGPLGALLARTMRPSGALFRALFAVSPVRALVSWVLDRFDGPAVRQGFTADEAPLGGELDERAATGRAIACVNCGECNSVCPIFHESKVRLPQMLTHVGETLHAGWPIDPAGSALLDLCMRCGNCEEVCQAGIPHLPLYAAMQSRSDEQRPPDRERHVLLLERLRASGRYTRGFLDARPGGYVKRTPAALPGDARFILLRAENDGGPAQTCIHCGACVDVCPTAANKEYEGDDPRWITTDQERCIGCGTCVEVCPANHQNGGQTLRVMEAPTVDWFDAMREFSAKESS